jgi:pilus assembly protein CpaB
MRARGFLIVALALILAAGAVFLVQRWMSQQQGQTVVEQQGPKMTTVVVARTPLRYGDRIRAEHIRAVEWPAEFVPEGAFQSVDDVLVKEGRVALRAFEPNEPLLKSRVSGPGGRASMSTRIDPNMRAATISVNTVLSVGGFVEPDDRVDILLTWKGDDDQLATDILLQNVRVLAVDQQIQPDDKTAVAKSVTVELTPEQVQKLTLARSVGQFSVALRNVGDVEPIQARSITVTDLKSTEAPREQTLAAESAEPAQAAPAPATPVLAETPPITQPAQPAETAAAPEKAEPMPAEKPAKEEEMAKPEEPKMVPVVVARVRLPFGGRIGPQHLAIRDYPADQVPEGAFTSVEEVLGPQPRKVLEPIEPNEPLLASKVTDPGGRATLSSIVEPERRAVTIAVNAVLGVAGFVKPDDRVDVVLTRDNNGAAESRTLLQNMKVLAADQQVTTENEVPEIVNTVTLEADPTQATKLILGSTVGTMSLVLRSNKDEEQVESKAVTVSNLFTDKPQVAEKPSASGGPVYNPYASVKIRRGMTVTTESVRKE